ncbi:helix-turn-helix domain-containing protein [Vibrio sp. ZSDZ65]|uniref:Helix-turn-helix domain-containing protein n=1 Tax=Vibrio qingdaonensis TaxID=2829491 RepID=A0A9X3HZD8_9VIBR|nr:helix-turn-helix transcriptional regulator [Vibrio qingdaonensis]MCW8348742.1 helix-turn-helix domain-containing protein [Vibrio qingdaonensis]
MKDIGKKIKSSRTGKGINQTQLANMLGVKPQTVSGWERGISRPDVSILKKLSSVLDMPVELLIDETKINFDGVAIPMLRDISSLLDPHFNVLSVDDFYSMPRNASKKTNKNSRLICFEQNANPLITLTKHKVIKHVFIADLSMHTVPHDGIYLIKIHNQIHVKSITISIQGYLVRSLESHDDVERISHHEFEKSMNVSIFILGRVVWFSVDLT